MDYSRFNDPVTEYALAVVNGKKELACKAEIDACKRHLHDLERTDIEWRPKMAKKHIKLAEMLTYEDKNAKCRKQVKLRGFEKFIIGSLFGWYKDGVRRFREAFIQVARKNGKTFLCGFFCVDFALASGIQRAQIYTAGTNYDNARRTYDAVVEFIESDPELNELFKIQDYRNMVIAKDTKATIKALSGDTKRDGYLPALNLIDEYHLHPDDSMYNTLIDGQVGLNDALTVVVTTAGFNLNSPCYAQYRYAKNIVSEVSKDDNLFVYIAECDLPDAHREGDAYEEELWNERRWAQANPLLLYDESGLKITKDPVRWNSFRSAATKAKEQGGSLLRDFITKKLNLYSTVGSDLLVSRPDLEACESEKSIDAYYGKRAFLGLDLSSKNDLASWALVFPPQDGVEKPYIWSLSYLPKATLDAHIRKDKAPYDYWYKIGWLKLTDCGGSNGFILDYKYILQDMKDIIAANNLQIVMLLYDPMGISAVLSDLEEICSELVEVGQWPKSLNDATRNFRDTLKAAGLEYDMSNRLLVWSIQNAEIVENAKKELIVDKKNKHNRIDPVDAILNAWKGAMTESDMQAKSAVRKQNLEAWVNYMRNL